MKKVVVTEPLPKFVTEKLRKKCKLVYRGMIKRKNLEHEIRNADVLIVRSKTRVGRDLIDRAEKLRAVITATHGFEHVDAGYLRKKKIRFYRTPSAAIGVTELVFGLMISLLRNIPKADQSVRKKRWLRERFIGNELFGKTLGIVGLGPIGQDVYRMARHFGMKIAACDPNHMATENDLERLNIKLKPLSYVLKKADILTLHEHLNEKTRYLIGAKEIKTMKEGSYIINTARGALLNNHVLFRALRTGHIAGAALDVYEEEPPKNLPLIRLPNVILTPHIGIQTEEGMERIGKKVLQIAGRYI